MPFLQIGDWVHYYQVDGAKEKPALIFANSLGSDLRIWDGVVACLPPQFKLIRYDLRGHGLTEAPAPPYAAADLAQDIVGLLDSLKIEAAVVCGAADIATPPDLGRELAGLIPGADFSLIDNTAHLPCVEQPVAVSERMLRFFQEVQIG